MFHQSPDALRQLLIGAKPWQRYLLAAAMVAGGVVLVLAGHVAGVALAGAGLLLGGRLIQYRLRVRGAAADDPPAASR